MADPVGRADLPATEVDPGPGDSVLQRRLALSDMLDLPTFTEVCRGFAELYRIGVKVYEERGPKLVDVRGEACEFCAYLFAFPDARSACMRTAGRVKDGPLEPTDGARSLGASGGPLSVPCFSGCCYLVTPIRLEGDLLGRAVFGPFVPDDLADLPPSLHAAAGPALQPERARDLLRRMRRAPEATVARVMGQFGAVVDALVFAGQKVLLTSQVHIEATREAFREIEAKNRELVEINERLFELDRLKSNFLATVSHELRTPLTSIIGYSEMLMQGMAGPLNAEQDEFVRIVMEKGESLLSLIRSILDITQIEAGRVRLTLVPVEIDDLVNRAADTVRPQAQTKGLSLEVRPTPAMARPLVDREKLGQCVVNLLANAVKFTAAGGQVRVRVLPEAPEGLLPPCVEGFAIQVEDTGIGIPEAHRERIFETFYQVDQSSTRQYGGAGLGLAIVKSYVEAHGGAVNVESDVGKGSRFTLAIPQAPAVERFAPASPFV